MRAKACRCISPADLSASLGYPDNAGQPDVQRIIEQSIRRIRAAGNAAGDVQADSRTGGGKGELLVPPQPVLVSGQRLRQQRDGMFAAFAGGHLNLPFAGFTIGHHQVGAALLNLPEQRRANRLR